MIHPANKSSATLNYPRLELCFFWLDLCFVLRNCLHSEAGTNIRSAVELTEPRSEMKMKEWCEFNDMHQKNKEQRRGEMFHSLWSFNPTLPGCALSGLFAGFSPEITLKVRLVKGQTCWHVLYRLYPSLWVLRGTFERRTMWQTPPLQWASSRAGANDNMLLSALSAVGISLLTQLVSLHFSALLSGVMPKSVMKSSAAFWWSCILTVTSVLLFEGSIV